MIALQAILALTLGAIGFRVELRGTSLDSVFLTLLGASMIVGAWAWIMILLWR